MLSHLVEYLWTWNRFNRHNFSINIGGSSRLLTYGTTSSISDLNIVPNDNAVRFDTFVTTATNKPASGNNANGVITFTIMVRSMVNKLPLLIMTTYILED
jgi:hypothetical protein